MRILLFRGTFSWDQENTHNGLIAWVHLNPEDEFITLEIGLKKIKKIKYTNEDVLLVPFCFLDDPNRTMDFGDARKMFNLMVKMSHNFNSVPFIDKNLLKLDLPMENQFLKHITI